MKYVGIDIGTTSVKAAIFSEDGALINSSTRRCSLLVDEFGHVEIETSKLLYNIKEVLLEVTQNSNVNIEPVSIAVSSLGEAIFPLDASDNPCGNGIVATDCRGKDEVSETISQLGRAKIEETTGMPISGSFSIYKVFWLKKNQPDRFKKFSYIPCGVDLVNYFLCGIKAIDYSLASRTGFFDQQKFDWSEAILNTHNVSASLFSSPTSAGSILGKVRPKIAEELHISKNSVVVCGSHDQFCALLGSGVCEVGDTLDSIGSTEGILPVISSKINPRWISKYGFCSQPYINDKYFTNAYLHTHGILQNWFINNFIKYEEFDGNNVYDYIESHIPEEISDIIVYPHFSGSATPHFNESATGIISGLTLNSTPLTIYKALLEGLCFAMKENIDALENSGIHLKEIIAVGGGSKSRKLLQLKSDIFQRPIIRASFQDASLLGAAILTIAADKKCSPSRLSKQIVCYEEPIFPNTQKAYYYHEKYQRYLDLTKKIYADITERTLYE